MAITEYTHSFDPLVAGALLASYTQLVDRAVEQEDGGQLQEALDTAKEMVEALFDLIREVTPDEVRDAFVDVALGARAVSA